MQLFDGLYLYEIVSSDTRCGDVSRAFLFSGFLFEEWKAGDEPATVFRDSTGDDRLSEHSIV